MSDTTVKKVSSATSPKGEMGQIYLTSGKHVAMRLWRDEPPQADKSAAKRIDIDAYGLHRVWKGEGCEHCRNTGYRGRTGVYELLVMDNDLRLEVQRRRGSEELRAMAITKGMRTLLEDGVRAARAGITTIDEILRVARA